MFHPTIVSPSHTTQPVLVKPGRHHEKYLPALESFEDLDMFQPYSKRFEEEDFPPR